MVKTNAAIYIRKSSDAGTSSSDDQLHELDIIGNQSASAKFAGHQSSLATASTKKNAAPEVGIPLGMWALWENGT